MKKNINERMISYSNELFRLLFCAEKLLTRNKSNNNFTFQINISFCRLVSVVNQILVN